MKPSSMIGRARPVSHRSPLPPSLLIHCVLGPLERPQSARYALPCLLGREAQYGLNMFDELPWKIWSEAQYSLSLCCLVSSRVEASTASVRRRELFRGFQRGEQSWTKVDSLCGSAWEPSPMRGWTCSCRVSTSSSASASSRRMYSGTEWNMQSWSVSWA